jgi:sugar/nucleoside kinase (ribokinase family)
MDLGTGFEKIVGTGGIGYGMLFHSDTMETLGRSESRPVTLSNAKDYCKQQIVFYYVSTFTKGTAQVFPIGFVGNDVQGRNLIAEMEREGMDVSYIGISPDKATMISICLQYPDKEGCNFTAVNNATTRVTADFVQKCMEKIGIDQKTIVAAIPEVSIESRVAMLRLGKEKGAFNVLSIPVAEADEFLRLNIFVDCDLLAVNEAEGQAILGRNLKGEQLTSRLFSTLSKMNPEIRLLVTCGSKGAYSAVKGSIEFIPPLMAKVINTTGAGDAFLGGTLAGLTRGLPLQKHRNDQYFGETMLESAAELGALCAGMAVETEDSIAFHVTPQSVKEKISGSHWEAAPCFIS